MRDLCSYDYAVIRVVPRVEREEFINAGVIVSCPKKDFLQVRVELDESRLKALNPDVDIEMVREGLAAMELICKGGQSSGPIGQLKLRERFHWLVAPRSTVIQTSAVHTGRCDDPDVAIEHLLKTMVRVPAAKR